MLVEGPSSGSEIAQERQQPKLYVCVGPLLPRPQLCCRQAWMRACSRRAGVLRGHTEPGGRAAIMRTGEETTLHRPSSGVLPAALRSGWGEERSGPRILGVLTVRPRDTWGCGGSPSKCSCGPGLWTALAWAASILL